VATREQHLRHKYGIDLVDYNQMLSEQDGKCKICKAEVKRLVVDHCHTSKRIRGLLCHKCNTGIGLLKESKNIMTEAINYLARFENHCHHLEYDQPRLKPAFRNQDDLNESSTNSAI
jgi:hypothetical protein